MTIRPTSVQPSAVSQTQSPFQKGREAFESLEKAMQSGDLAAAQKAYATLTSLPKPAKTSGGSSGGDPVAASMDSLGQALQSGDMSKATQAFNSITQAIKSHHKPHPWQSGRPRTHNGQVPSPTSGSGSFPTPNPASISAPSRTSGSGSTTGPDPASITTPSPTSGSDATLKPQPTSGSNGIRVSIEA